MRKSRGGGCLLVRGCVGDSEGDDGEERQRDDGGQGLLAH